MFHCKKADYQIFLAHEQFWLIVLRRDKDKNSFSPLNLWFIQWENSSLQYFGIQSLETFWSALSATGITIWICHSKCIVPKGQPYNHQSLNGFGANFIHSRTPDTGVFLTTWHVSHPAASIKYVLRRSSKYCIYCLTESYLIASSWSWITRLSLYPHEDVQGCVGVWPTRIHAFSGLREGFQSHPSHVLWGVLQEDGVLGSLLLAFQLM